jgi:hypothetical protein
MKANKILGHPTVKRGGAKMLPAGFGLHKQADGMDSRRL